MPRTIEVREPQTKFDLHLQDDTPEYYADDMTQLLLGYPMSKILFHRTGAPLKFNTEEQPTDVEQRYASFHLVLPTASLINLARNILQAAANAKPQMDIAATNYKNAYDQLLASVHPAVSTPAPLTSTSKKS